MSQPNSPDLWLPYFPVFKDDSHKYDRGMAVIYGAPKMTGATRLAAEACARMGAGLVKVIAPEGTGDIYRSSLPAHIVVEDEDPATPERPIFDPKCRAVLLGPGCPPDPKYQVLFHRAIDAPHVNGLVLDAGAFSVWRGKGMDTLHAFSSYEKVVVTPHEGEFSKFFESYGDGPSILALPEKEDRARAAAIRINGVVLLKGAKTVIANGQRMVVQDEPLPQLATAGTGDVLAGMIAGLAAQGMPVFYASCAAVWLHAECAKVGGMGLVAGDLPNLIQKTLQKILT